MNYFFDSSVIIEIINQNENYSHFQGLSIVTNTLNLAEVYHYLLKEHNAQTAEFWVSHLDLHFLQITSEIAIEAAKLRYQNKKENLSYADCIGYITSSKNGLQFLTADSKFKGKTNVEFCQ